MTLRDYPGMTRMQAFEASEDAGRNLSKNETIGDVINARFGRRGFLRGALGVTAAAALMGGSALVAPRNAKAATMAPHMNFEEIAHGVDETHHVAPGHTAEVLIRWGDPIGNGGDEFDPLAQSASTQAMQFGYNNDFIGYVPLPLGSDNSEHGLLCVTHEYTDEQVMFPGISEDNEDFKTLTVDQVDIEMMAHGGSVLEVKKEGGKWMVVAESSYARRVTANTYMELTGPAAGDELMKTSGDPGGTLAQGTINNCAGGVTPWGTYLLAEENFHGYFWGVIDGHPLAASYDRYGVPGGWYGWGRFYDRFNVNVEPNEPHRFGWVVEIDPTDPSSTPKKRTALGRFKHEGAETLINKDGHVVVYMGDDERFDYVYRFVTSGTYNPDDRAANMDLLDEGTLSVARYNADGTVDWLPLVHGEGPLTAENGFASQADVVIHARLAGDLLGATKMDRPEDVQGSADTGKVYVMLTNNTRRKAGQEDAANPRADNVFGHIIEMSTPDQDHTAAQYTWEILVRCGNPADGSIGAMWNASTSENGWFAAPDNCVIDSANNLWISTDQGSAWAKSGTADGLYALGTEGEARGMGKMFFRVPLGAELCGPCFTPDRKTLFLAVQHPATDGVKAYGAFGRESTFEDPATRWPDFQDGMPPRPSVVVITKDDGGVIGG